MNSRLRLVPALVLISGCCRCSDDPVWQTVDPLAVDDGGFTTDLVDLVQGGSGELVFEVSSSDPKNLIATTQDSILELTGQPGWSGSATITLSVTDGCDRSDVVDVEVTVGEGDQPDDTGDPGSSGDDYFVDPCAVTFTYAEQGSPDSVFVAGTFNDWVADQYPMESDGNGNWSVSIPKEEIPPGIYTYKFVEVSGGSQAWACDPNAGLIQCDEGYKDVNDTTWTQNCALNATSCNSMVVVDDYDRPRLTVTNLDIDREAGSVAADIAFATGCSEADAATPIATLDDSPIDDAWTGDGFSVTLEGLADGRHTLRFDVTDVDGKSAEEAYVPFWIEAEDGWQKGFMYYAFVDRFVDGDTAINGSEGASYYLADYMNGDFQGVTDSLPYLQDLGVNIIWLANPQDNAAGPWAGDCGTYSGYHGYWPIEPLGVEGHFGGDTALQDLVDAAHDRGMRVVMDWVGNHVHQDHPYYQQHAGDWFNPAVMCRIGDDYSNFDLIPEVCWFADYLPDIRYYNPEPLVAMVEDALWWVKTYELDGFRVDGAKHVPHSVVWNLGTRLNQEVEHRYAGGDEDFYTVGETFTSSRDVVKAYVNDNELDGQFDFPLYYSIRGTFISTTGFAGLRDSMNASRDVYGDALMSPFLGNHDVSRFMTYAADPANADSSGLVCSTADIVYDAWWYDRLEAAFTYLLTNPGIPLVYYGDEIGMPGYRDPDNRHPFQWYSATLNDGHSGSFTLDDYLAGMYHTEMMGVPQHVAALGQARAQHPAFWSGTESEWWLEDPYCYAYTRATDDDGVIVLYNLYWEDRTFTNGLAFAGLPTDGTWVDVLTGETFSASADSLSVNVPANSTRVLVMQ